MMDCFYSCLFFDTVNMEIYGIKDSELVVAGVEWWPWNLTGMCKLE